MGRTVPQVKSKRVQLSAGLIAVESATEIFADRHRVLVKHVTALDDELRAVKKRYIKTIRSAAAEAKDARSLLEAALEQSKGEFEKPRTRTFHGIKVGFRKLVGSITWKDGERVVELIKKHFPNLAELLIKTVETPVKDSLKTLSVADIKKLGCEVAEDTDVPVISASDSDVDKLVDALLKEAADSGN